MRAVCFLAVLLLAKVLMLAGQPWTITGWTPFAWFSHDVVVGATIWLVDWGLGRPRFGWIAYGAGVFYIALNVSIANVTSSPLTPAMLGAAGRTLADSITYHADWRTLSPAALVAVAGLVLPVVWARTRRFGGRAMTERVQVATAVAACAAAAMLGPFAVSRADTRGLHRNALTALLPATLPSVAGLPEPRDWRASPAPSPWQAGVDLTRYRGAAAGMNVLMVVLESAGARYLAPYDWITARTEPAGARERVAGSERARTERGDAMPNLTALSRRALVFENAYAAYPESVKGLLSTLCSSYPAFSQSVEVQASRPCHSIAAELRDLGYRTALFHSGRFGYLGMDAVVAGRGFDEVEDAGAIGGSIRSSFGVDEPATVGRILEWIDALDPDRRFFVTYLPIAGHHPYVAPGDGPFRGASEFFDYLNALHNADDALGRLLSGLRARGLDDRTLVLVFGDHGEAFGQHPGNTGHSLFIYDENIRVPYLIAVPGAVGSTGRVPGVASLIDTAPTILDLLGLPPARLHEGTSLLEPRARMALFLTDYALGWLGLRDGCWKYQLETGSGRSKLFDVCRDRDETRDLSEIEDARVRAYRRHLEHWSRSGCRRAGQCSENGGYSSTIK